MQPITLQELAERLGGEVHGDASQAIHSVATLAKAESGQITFLSNSKYRSQLAETNASAVLLGASDLEHCPCNAIVLDNPYVGFAKVAQLLDTTPDAASTIAATAIVDPTATLGRGVKLGHHVVIEAGAVIGDYVQIGHGSVIGRDVKIGDNTKLWANVTLYHSVQMGNDCLIHSGAVIGADGFGYANDKGEWVKIPQVGTVILGNRVEIGASTTVDRGALEDTIIKDGVIIDNQCQIAHNVVINENAAMAGCSVIAGSTSIGKYCTIGGLSAISGHMQIGDNVHFTGMSMVTKNISEPGLYSSGLPVVPNREWRKNAVHVRNLGSLNQRVKALEKDAAEKN